MIVLDNKGVQIEDVVQILVIENERIRCLLKDGVIEIRGKQFYVYSLTDKDLTVKGVVKTVELDGH